MRIAQVAPLYESVPPRTYGGTERVVSYLTEELVELGHDVTLFASGDSVTKAELVPCCAQALRLGPKNTDATAQHMLLLEKVMQRADEFDVVHFHVDYLHFPLSRRQQLTQLTTLHGRLDLPDLAAVYSEFNDMPVVSISDAQREPLPQARWTATVHHGLPRSLHRAGTGAGGYFAFLGRVSPEKRLDRAVAVAKALGVPLKVAAKIDPADVSYYEREIKHLLDDPLVEFIGEIGDADKTEFLGNARALLFPIDWPEPFGLVMIEAMACGTPTIAFRRGSVTEIIEDGVSGFIVDDVDSAIRAAARTGELDRRTCRAAFDKRFAATRMAKNYVALYENLRKANRLGQGHRASEVAA
ncbi:MAG TPA: glycosyltransferase family 4 protein [Polyangiaceae bacterium]